MFVMKMRVNSTLDEFWQNAEGIVWPVQGTISVSLQWGVQAATTCRKLCRFELKGLLVAGNLPHLLMAWHNARGKSPFPTTDRIFLSSLWFYFLIPSEACAPS